MDFGNAFRRLPSRSFAVFTVLSALAQIPAALAQDAATTLIDSDICTIPGMPVPDPLDEVSGTGMSGFQNASSKLLKIAI